MSLLKSTAVKALAATFSLLLVFSLLPAAGNGSQKVGRSATAVAQTSTEPVEITNSYLNRNVGKLVVEMQPSTSMNMSKLTLTSNVNFAARSNEKLRKLTIDGVDYPISYMSVSGKTLTVSIPGGVEVQPYSSIVIEWGQGQQPSNLKATMQGQPISSGPVTPPTQGNPLHSGSYREIPLSRTWDSCSSNRGVVVAKTWWDNTSSALANGGVDVVQVDVNDVDVPSKLDVSDSRLKLRFGSQGDGWQELQNGVDYTVFASGNSVFFALKTTKMRPPANVVSYDVEAHLPIQGGASGCKVSLWNEYEAPAEGNPTSPSNFVKIPNDRVDDKCTYAGGVLYSRTYWDQYQSTKQRGQTDVVEVVVNNVSNLAQKVALNDPRLRLRYGGDESGWTELRADSDFTVTVSGNSLFFDLREPMKRVYFAGSYDSKEGWKPRYFDVEAYIPIAESTSNCAVNLWHEGPHWLDRNAPKLEINAPETPREQLDWLPNPSKNPAIPPRCGGKIALVFDLSGSVRRAGGLEPSRDAGLAVIDALQGTGSSMAIYNFSTTANTYPAVSTTPKNLNVPSDVQDLRRAVGAIENSSRGGTNYEDGLKQVPSGEYDVVYFITDGIPTTSNRDYPDPGFDAGELINQSDLSRAVTEANRLKDSGTRIETVMVGVESFNEHILKDDYFDIVELRKKDPSTWPTNSYGYPSYTPNEQEWVRDLLADGQPVAIWDKPEGTEYIVNNQPELWRAGVRNTHRMAADISSPDAVTTVDSYQNLVKELSDLILDNCFGSINITKNVYDENGIKSPGQGWTFDTSVDSGKQVLIGDGVLTEQTRDVTSADGSYGRTLNQSDGQGQAVTVVEHQQDGYNLRPQNGENAVCTTRQYVTTNGKAEWKDKPTTIRNINDASRPGFGVNVPFRGIVNCVIENEKVAVEIDLSLEKVSFDDQPEQLSGAEFTLFEVNGDQRTEVAVITDGKSRVENLGVGKRYELVETLAPAGYQLLARPIVFDVVKNESGNPEIRLEGGAGEYPEISIKVDKNEVTHSIMQVADIRKGDLPKTGGYGIGWLIIGSVLAAGAAFMTSRKTARKF
ncbi:SpaA isopeptide-forming pilin-related protein [Corynebacterium renale]|uniref:SpaA isopeptide-forming pilin-related protein n=1 Tax=Corynebacterium renale TaxID=1724 RepID=UPI001178417F|nr:SpaA isopeptide-forming pilin-related protein [Corynebacterium renale]